MFSKAQNKYIRSLTQQKYRKEYNVFIAEGVKVVEELLKSSRQVQMIVAIEEWVAHNEYLVKKHPEATLYTVKEHELEAVSALQTPNKVLVVAYQPEQPQWVNKNEWCLMLDDIRDPGNMGTIIRIADWYGIKHIICSENCVDVYSPKVIQGAMGSHLRVNIYNNNLKAFIEENQSLPVLAATLNGENIYSLPKMDAGIILIGNESTGVSNNLIALAQHKITIPRKGGAESLNAAVSTGIICALLIGR